MELPRASLNREPPTCIAIVLCAEVIEDKRTSNRTLIHLFNTINVARLPARQPTLCVLYSLTDGRGEWTVRLTIDTPSGQTLFQADNRIVFHDPLGTIDYVAEILGLPLAEAGEYRIELSCGHRPLGSRRFRVIEQAQGDPPRRPQEER
jgi:hypothetical protein